MGINGRLTVVVEIKSQSCARVKQKREKKGPTPVPPREPVPMPEQEGLGDLLSHKGFECPSAIRGRDEPRAGCDAADTCRQTGAVDGPPKLLVPPQEVAAILVDADLGPTCWTTRC